MKKTIAFISTLFAVNTACAGTYPDWAAEYALKAVTYQKQNIELRCDYGDKRWHSDVEEHQRFATTIGKATAEFENNVRQIAISQCQNAWIYADQAATQHEENERRHCNLKGDMWHSDQMMHFTWAMQQTPYTIATNDQQRRTLLARCESDR
ncbi:hypothetical protein [Cellvibrio sp. UBA7661]|uniref:hypothetical protein n=1 Tax=Cellvibrio sp. UBA7661 TaxID=1946311 RepID=UPI002F358C3A